MAESTRPFAAGQRAEQLLLAVLAAYAATLAYQGFVVAPGLFDNDWPLLMWLAKRASLADPSALAVGHYGVWQLVLVRLLLPLVGSTLVAAKLLNIAATAAAGWFVFRIAAELTHSRRWAYVALVLFLGSHQAVLTGQSEFGDPVPTALFVAGAWLLVTRDGWRAWLVAGLLWGVGGGFRLHFQSYALAALLPAAGLALTRRDGWRGLGALAGGVALGILPIAALNGWYHGTFFSPLTSNFVGQALLGMDDYDVPGTHARFPMHEVLRHHGARFARFVADRLTSMPARGWAGLALGLAPVVLRKERRAEVAFLWLLAAGYYVAFVCPSFGMTPRLLLPFVMLVSLLAALGVAALPGGKITFAVATALTIAVSVPERQVIRDSWGWVNHHWARSQELTQVLREHGLTEPRRAFVSFWNRFLVDDPELVSFYNFGFWNLLYPAFAAERPNPWPHMQDVARFAAFMQAQGVSFVVLERGNPRLAALAPVIEGEQPLPGYERIADLPDDVVFARSATQ